jgi:hypothetical protein
MSHFGLFIAVLAAILASGCSSNRPARELATTTSTNIDAISSRLKDFQKMANSITDKRNEAIVAIEVSAASERLVIDGELDTLRQTGAAETAKLFDVLRLHSEKASATAGQLEQFRAQTSKEVAALTAPLVISTSKLEQAAKTLAALGADEPAEDRAAFLLDFVKAVRDETKKTKETASAKQTAGDQAIDAKRLDMASKPAPEPKK